MTEQVSREDDRHVGRRVRRLEDNRLLCGAGRFVDDVDVPGQLWARVVRSQFAHGRLVAIDASGARALRGVHAVLTGEDLKEVGPIPLRLDWGFDLDPFLQPVLARHRVRYVGEPVAIVLADTPYLAEDAAELVEVDIDPLDVVLDARDGLSGESVLLRDGQSNEVVLMQKHYGDVDTAFRNAAHVVHGEFKTGRHTGVPLETRGLLAEYDPGRGHLTIWGATLVAHYHRRVVSRMLDIPLSRIHCRPTDSGGSFGVRGDFYPEDFLIPFLAYHVGRPVKWVEDRLEHLIASTHARDQRFALEAAFDPEGVLLGLRGEIWHDKGAYIRPTGVSVSYVSLEYLPGPYRLPAYEAKLHVVTTNKTPVGPYRAPGRYETTFARERLFDIAAAQIGIEPADLRRINLLDQDDIPWEPGPDGAAIPFVLDSGDFLGHFEKALEASDYEVWLAEAAQLRAEGRLVGVGLGYWLDKSGLGHYETAGVDIDPSGSVRVLTGGASVGQGIETILAQIAADELSVEPHSIEVVYGDTDLIPDGVGSWSGRSTVFAGSSVQAAARATADKAKRVTSRLLEVGEADLILVDGRVQVVGSPSRSVSLGEIAEACDTLGAAELGEQPGLGAREIYVDDHLNHPYGLVVVQVELDPETGETAVRRCFCSCECGNAINPMLVEGQIHGGIAQGLGGALLEEFVFDETGQPQAATFIDYLLPTANEVPAVSVLLTEDAPTPTNPLGAKGIGEAGLIGMGAAIANAIDDALAAPGTIVALPVRPEVVRSAAEGLTEKSQAPTAA